MGISAFARRDATAGWSNGRARAESGAVSNALSTLTTSVPLSTSGSFFQGQFLFASQRRHIRRLYGGWQVPFGRQPGDESGIVIGISWARSRGKNPINRELLIKSLQSRLESGGITREEYEKKLTGLPKSEK